MTTALHIVAALAIAAIVVPLLLLLLYTLADALKLSFASRILEVAYRALMFEFAIGTIVNVVGGLAIIALGVWGGFAAPKILYRMLALVIVPYGAWRVWRGVAIWLPAAPKPQPPDQGGGKGRAPVARPLVPNSFCRRYGGAMASPDERKIIHVDMDAFFASVEQRDNPALRGRPVAVGYAAARGVVAAASYEARTFGVRSALPSVTALRRCPDLVFVAPRFEVYKAVSRQIHEIFADYTDLVQPLSLDEAYLDVTANRRGLPTAWATAKEIRARILAETGLTASAGISYNKFLAKLASDQRKPNGQFAVTPDMGAAWVATLPVSRFHGVGPVTATKMKRLGIETGGDLRGCSLDVLQQHFGSSAEWYHGIARGIDHRPVNPHRERKSSGSETTFDRDLLDDGEIEAGVLGQANEVWAWCERVQAFGRTITVKVKYGDFQIITRSRTHSAPVTTQALLRHASRALIRSVLPTAKGIRLLGVTVSTFDRPAQDEALLPLFGEVASIV